MEKTKIGGGDSVKVLDSLYETKSPHSPLILCDLYARNVVHAAMAGKAGLVIGYLHDSFIHVPIEMLAREKKQIDPDSVWWTAVLAATGQAARFE